MLTTNQLKVQDTEGADHTDMYSSPKKNKVQSSSNVLAIHGLLDDEPKLNCCISTGNDLADFETLKAEKVKIENGSLDPVLMSIENVDEECSTV